MCTNEGAMSTYEDVKGGGEFFVHRTMSVMCAYECVMFFI